MTEMREVYSSHVAEIGFENGELTVTWSSGKTSVYSGVPESTANEVMSAASVGSALRELVKGQYSHKYI
jgi:hypothetical protein